MTCCDQENLYIPREISAGFDFSALVSLDDYPAPAWSLALVVRGPQVVNLASSASGKSHSLHAAAAVTGTWAAGDYWYSLRATNGTNTVEVDKGSIQVLPDMAAITGVYDGRSQAEIALEAINAILGKRATLDQERYTINNRELWRTPIADLLKLQSFYRVQVRREKNCKAGKNTFGRAIGVRF